MDRINKQNPLLPRKLNPNGDQNLFSPNTNNGDQNPLDKTKSGQIDNHPKPLDFARHTIDKENIPSGSTYPDKRYEVLNRAYQRSIRSWYKPSDQGYGTNPFRKIASEASDMEADFKARYPEVPRDTNPFRNGAIEIKDASGYWREERSHARSESFDRTLKEGEYLHDRVQEWKDRESLEAAFNDRYPKAEDAKEIEARYFGDKLKTLLYRKFGDEIVESDLLRNLGTSKTDTEVTKIRDGNPSVHWDGKRYNVAFDENHVPEHFGKRVQLNDEVLQALEKQEQRGMEDRGNWDLPKVYRIHLEKPDGETRVLITDNEKHAQKLIQEQRLNGKVFDLSGSRKSDHESNQGFFQHKVEEHQEYSPPPYEEANSRESLGFHEISHEYKDYGYSSSKKQGFEYDEIRSNGETQDKFNNTFETEGHKEYDQYDAPPPSYALIHLRTDYKFALANNKAEREILELEEKYRDLYDKMKDQFKAVASYPKEVREKMGRLHRARREFVEEDSKPNGNSDKALKKVKRRLQKTMKSIEKALSRSGGREIIKDTTNSSSKNQYDSKYVPKVDDTLPSYADAVRGRGLPSVHEKHDYSPSKGEKQRAYHEYVNALEKSWTLISGDRQPIPSDNQRSGQRWPDMSGYPQDKKRGFDVSDYPQSGQKWPDVSGVKKRRQRQPRSSRWGRVSDLAQAVAVWS